MKSKKYNLILLDHLININMNRFSQICEQVNKRNGFSTEVMLGGIKWTKKRGQEKSQLIRCLQCKRKNLSSDPQHTYEKSDWGTMPLNSSTGEGETD